MRTHFCFAVDIHFIRFEETYPKRVKEKRITIQDVARYANVSAGTVDRVIHNRGRVSSEKRVKIEEAIKELNFNPNILARTLALGNQFNISVLIPSAPSHSHYWTMPLHGLESSAQQYKDYGINTDFYFYDLFDENSFIAQTKSIFESEPDGVVIAPSFVKEAILFTNMLKEKGIPYVFIDADIPDGHSFSYIGPDLKQSACVAGRLLSSVLLADSKILMVNMVKGFENAPAMKRIEEGFKSSVNSKTKNRQTVHILTIHSTKREEVFKELSIFYQKNPEIKGAFVTNSKAFLLSEFHRNNNMDIRLAGYDLVDENIRELRNGGIDFIISQSPEQQGRRAVQTLFDYFVLKKEPDKVQYVPLDIIIRENLDFHLNFNRNYQNGTQNKII